MDLRELLTKLFDEQKWREQQARKLSSGFGTMPYTFDQQMERRLPLLFHAYQQQDEQANKSDQVFTANDAPDYAPQRYFLNDAMNMHRKRLEDMYKTPM